MAHMTKQQEALKASYISAKRSPEKKSEASRKGAQTRFYYIEQSLRLGADGPMSFKDAGRKGAAMRWGNA